MSETVKRGWPTWAWRTRKVYEADPLSYPKCKIAVRVIATIENPAVVRGILSRLRRWAPEPSE